MSWKETFEIGGDGIYCNGCILLNDDYHDFCMYCKHPLFEKNKHNIRREMGGKWRRLSECMEREKESKEN